MSINEWIFNFLLINAVISPVYIGIFLDDVFAKWFAVACLFVFSLVFLGILYENIKHDRGENGTKN